MTSRQKIFFILLPILLLALTLRLIGIDNPLLERKPSDWRQTQTDVTAQGYLQHGFKFFYPEVNFMGRPGYFALEFPLYQYLVALLYKFLGENVIWGRLLTIATSLGALSYLYFILRRYFGEVAASAGALYFAIIPLSAYYGRTVMIDVPVLFLSLGFTYHFLSYWQFSSRRSFFLAVILAVLAFLIKVTVAVVFFVPLLIIPWFTGKRGVYKRWEFYFFFLLPLLPAYFWNSYSEGINLKYAAVTVQFAPQALRDWALGPISMRWDGDFYRFLSWRMIHQNLTWAGICLAGGGIVLSFIRKELRVLLFYPAAGVGYLLLFTNLNFIHDYYQLPLVPIYAAFLGVFVGLIAEKIENYAWQKNLLTRASAEKLLAPMIVGLCGILLLIPSAGELGKYSDGIDRELISTGKQVQKLLPPEALVISVTYDEVPLPKYSQVYFYNSQPTNLYAVGRRGWHLNYSRFTLSKVELLKQQGAQFLVMDSTIRNPDDGIWQAVIVESLRKNYKEIFVNPRLSVYDLNQPL